MSSKSLKILLNNISGRLLADERRAAWLAEKAGVSKAMVSRVLSGTTNPSLEIIDSFADALKAQSQKK